MQAPLQRLNDSAIQNQHSVVHCWELRLKLNYSFVTCRLVIKHQAQGDIINIAVSNITAEKLIK